MITKKQYDKNQKILEDQKRNTSNERGKTDWKLKGIISCGKCGRAYLAEKTDLPYKSKKTGKVNKHYYIGYHCTRGVYFAKVKIKRNVRHYLIVKLKAILMRTFSKNKWKRQRIG